MTLVPRDAVYGNALSVSFSNFAYANTEAEPRLWFASFSYFGTDAGTNLYAYDGEQTTGDVTSPTAAASLVELKISGPTQLAGVKVKVAVPISDDDIVSLGTLISEVKAGTSSSNQLLFGDSNDKQERKKDGVWTYAVELKNSFALCPIKADEMVFTCVDVGLIGGTTSDIHLYILTFDNMMIDSTTYTQTSIPVIHDNSDSSGEYPLQSIASSS
ncbi:type VI secretion system tube protein IglC [uncultured Shewanella sp.]|uniref:type VI secretion system tube protein IglC n=1 Tax=uncultured Shewanella sp. TaxID=173975 RepID=UPI00261AD7B2|nr:type VI secretion system tube protein IglC [uncultured Shewanella sp.]